MKPAFDFSFVEASLKPFGGLSYSRESKTLPSGFQRIITDSRQVKPGDFFVAIEGEKVDGHDFIPAAIQAGATGILASAQKLGHLETAMQANVAVFSVHEPHSVLEAYRALGHAWRSLFSIPIIGVAGSVGKTTTKEFLATLLKSRFSSVLKTEGSQNGFLGIPMTLLELRSHHEVAVVEVGIDEPGAMASHVELVRPDYAVMTKIGPEHLEKLQNVQVVAKEESLFLKWAEKARKSCIFNAHDELLAHALNRSPQLTGPDQIPVIVTREAKMETFSFELGQAGEKPTLSLTTKNFSLKLTCPIVGDHNASNLALGVAAVLHLLENLGASFQDLEKDLNSALMTFTPAKGRTQLKDLGRDVHLYGDFYNANPDSMAAALKTFQREKAALRIACLADMKELGNEEEKFHRELASLISEDTHEVLLLGEKMKWLFDELTKRGRKAQHFVSRADLSAHDAMAQALNKIILDQPRRPCMILLKGSRSMALEKVAATFEKTFYAH